MITRVLEGYRVKKESDFKFPMVKERAKLFPATFMLLKCKREGKAYLYPQL